MTKFEAWVAYNGGQGVTARIIGVSAVSVHKWLTGKNGISRRTREVIVAKSKGKLSHVDLIYPSSKKRAS